jgi:hypothetical protein
MHEQSKPNESNQSKIEIDLKRDQQAVLLRKPEFRNNRGMVFLPSPEQLIAAFNHQLDVISNAGYVVVTGVDAAKVKSYGSSFAVDEYDAVVVLIQKKQQ